MNKLILIVLMSFVGTYSRDNYSLSAYEGGIYLLDGFGMELTVYEKNGESLKKISLKNISPSGYFDHFIKYDKYVSYLTDSERSIIFVLDENFALKEQSDVFSGHGIRLYKKVYPSAYNSLLIASDEKDRIYSLTNNTLKEILNFDKGFTDFFGSADGIYVLSESGIFVYSADGIFKTKLSLAQDKKFSSIYYENGNIILGSSGEITKLSLTERKTESFVTEKFSSSLIASNIIYYFCADSLKLKSVKP